MIQDKNIQLEQFRDIDLADPFFDSLKESYREFENWFKRKASERAYLIKDDSNKVQAFLYLKIEYSSIDDVEPALPQNKYLKIGTFKINAHGTKLGERFIKKIFDYAVANDVQNIYVTSFPNQAGLVSLLKRYGFIKSGTKKSSNGTEDVYLKQIGLISNDVKLDYPIINQAGNQYLLSIYPEFHTRLFPDSILNNEKASIIDDVSHTNSIGKIYICKMRGVENLNQGDALIIYRTGDGQGSAYYRAVATSICMVEEVKTKSDFSSLEEFVKYCLARSIFTKEELEKFYKEWYKIVVIKMTYNSALKNRIIRKRLLEEVGLSENEYYGFLRLNSSQFKYIARLGEVSANIIID